MKKLGIVFDRSIEITDTAEVDDYLKFGEEASEGAASSAAAAITHTKPQRKGRAGKTKIKKFVADDE
jgi:hypothetical protein